ncbi:hypothetical protein L2E82_16630 [Cichorium intybus]|uniref:Uncharacterized protein n=1 Tax=Cichorium intybus TaxID=13427 RepID=A0ACB9F6J4_CICIN|nr:hypothetical protein L2E82_16630 [Cichorium intybus]
METEGTKRKLSDHINVKGIIQDNGLRRQNFSFADAVKGENKAFKKTFSTESKSSTDYQVPDKSVETKKVLILEVNKDLSSVLESKIVGEVKSFNIQVEQSRFLIRAKEMEGSIVEDEQESEGYRKEEDEVSSEELDVQESSEEEESDGFFDDDFDGIYEESITRESSPEWEGQNQKRENIIRTFNKEMEYSRKKEFSEKKDYLNDQEMVHTEGNLNSVIMGNPTSPSPTRLSPNPNKENLNMEVGEPHQNDSPSAGEESATNKSKFCQIKNKIHIPETNYISDAEDGELFGISDKMRILLSRDTPMVNKLNMIDEEDKKIPEKEEMVKRIGDIKGPKSKPEKRITRSQKAEGN